MIQVGYTQYNLYGAVQLHCVWRAPACPSESGGGILWGCYDRLSPCALGALSPAASAPARLLGDAAPPPPTACCCCPPGPSAPPPAVPAPAAPPPGGPLLPESRVGRSGDALMWPVWPGVESPRARPGATTTGECHVESPPPPIPPPPPPNPLPPSSSPSDSLALVAPASESAATCEPRATARRAAASAPGGAMPVPACDGASPVCAALVLAGCGYAAATAAACGAITYMGACS